MRISEVFDTIQGEGVLTGIPSLFIRTSGCNLRCVWCDTPYTSWSPEGADWTIAEIMDWVQRFPQYAHVVVTGGEPMIQPEIVELTFALEEAGKHITIETAGTVYQPVRCQLMSISPKLANSVPMEREEGKWSGQHDRLRIQNEVLRRLVREYDHQVKYVVCSEGDLEEIRGLNAAMGVSADKVLMMPEGVDAGVLGQRAEWLVDVCKAEGWRFCPRLHVMIYGNRRGV
jgi:7-carboxy-7-deazaguanine synthase